MKTKLSGPPPRPAMLSEELCRRDNFFHTCWMNMKVLHPEMMKAMTEIEISVAGLTPPEKESDDGTQEPPDRIL